MMMGSPIASSNGRTPPRATDVKDARQTGLATRVVAWILNVAIPKLIPDHVTAPLRARLRNADDRLERSARRFRRRQVDRGPTNPDGDAR
jgi:hypothetical protein